MSNQGSRIARYGGVHANLTAVISPTMGLSRGRQYTFRTLESINHDLAPKYASVGGTQIGPVNVVVAGAQPKWEGELDMVEAWEVQAFLGKGWAEVRFNLDITWQVPGNPAFTDHLFGCFLGSCAIASKKDDLVKAKVGAECTAIHPRGIDPFGVPTNSG